MTRQIAFGLGLTGIILFLTKAIWGRCHQSFALKNGFFAPLFTCFFALYKNQKK